MRTENIWSDELECFGGENDLRAKNRYQAKKLVPWAAKIMKTNSGWKAFESLADYYTEKNQK